MRRAPAMGERIWRMGITAALTDFALYLVWLAIPYQAIHLGADPARLGLMTTLSSSTYVLTTLWSGHLSDRMPRLHLARLGALIFSVGCLLILSARSLTELFMRLPLSGLGMGLFWPAVQAALADEGGLDDLEKNLGLFNVFWSGGKALGFLAGGSLFAAYGAAPIMAGVPITMLAVALLLPRAARHAQVAQAAPAAPVPPAMPVARPAPATQEQDACASAPPPYPGASGRGVARSAQPPTAARMRAFLYMAWAANAVAFGIGNTMNMQYPKFLQEIGHGPEVFGLFLGTIFAVQTVTFWFLRTHHGWRFRRGPTYAVQITAAAGVVLVAWARPVALILLAAVPLGIGLGVCYHASIIYSLIDRRGRGRRAGFHEALLGAGNFLLPLLGGLAASAAADLRMPYLLCGAIVLLGAGAQELIWRRVARAAAED